MFRQLERGSLDGWDLVPQAIIGRAPSFFAKERNIESIHGRDDFDDYSGADLLIESDKLEKAIAVALRRYSGYPGNTTTLYLPSSIVGVDIISRIISVVMSELKIPEEWLEWQRANDPAL